MTINVNAVAKVVSLAVSVGAPQAVLIAQQLLSLIEFAEEAYDGLKGDQKLQAVQAGLYTFVKQLDPNLDAQFSKLWQFLTPIVSVIVTIYRFAGIFTSKTPAKA
jgi:hypothetical protein